MINPIVNVACGDRVAIIGKRWVDARKPNLCRPFLVLASLYPVIDSDV